MIEYVVHKYRFNSAKKSYELIRELTVQVKLCIIIFLESGLKEVKEFYKYEIKSKSGNLLHIIYTIDSSLFD